MMTRISTALLISAAMATTACAEQAPSSQVAAPISASAPVAASASFSAPDSAWRTVDQDNLMYIKTKHGTAIVELFPEIAPKHVAQIKALTARGFYDFITFHRVIEGFMNQTGDPTGTGTGDSDLPDIEAEFTFRRDPSMKVTLLNKRAIEKSKGNNEGVIDVGFYKGLPVATQPSMQAALTQDGKVEAWGLHCKGVTSMARSSLPNSANSQFFLMRDEYSSLDRKYSIWGNTVWGEDVLLKIKVGAKGETPHFVPDQMDKVTIGSAMPAGEQVAVQVLKTSSAAFKAHLATQKGADGNYSDICDIDIPSRLKP